MNHNDKKWAFTELLGRTDDVRIAMDELHSKGLLHGTLCGKEEKGDKCFVQYYGCNSEVGLLSEYEVEKYNDIAERYHVCIEYTFMGRNCLSFPINGDHNFSVKYWEWWIAD